MTQEIDKNIALSGSLLTFGCQYSNFYPYRGMEGKFPGSVSETFSKGVRDWNYLFKGARKSFPEGSYQLAQAFQWDHTWKIVLLWSHFWHHPGIPAQK